MAKEEKRSGEGQHKKKLKLRAITTTKADDGGFVHEHHYEGEKGEHHPSRFGGVSSDMQDLHDHMDDHFGDGAAQDEQQDDPQDAAAAAGASQAAPAVQPGE